MALIMRQGSIKGEQDEKVRVQILAIIIACLSAITYGLLLAWTSPFMVKITNDKTNYNITEDEASRLTYISPIAMVAASAIFSHLSDRIGRKPTLMLTSIPHCISWVCTIASKNIYVFYLSRTFSGIADGCLLVTLPVYIGEIAVPRIRGVWGNLVGVCTFFGVFLINIIGSQCSAPVTACICLPLPVVFAIAMCFLPETPYWCIMHGEDERAKRSLRTLRGIQDVDGIFDKLKDEIDQQMKNEGTWRDLVMVPTNRRGLTAGLFLRISQLFGGAGALMTFTQYIFASLKIDVPSEIPTIAFSGICFTLMIFTGTVIERVGKRKCYIITCFLNSIVQLLEAVYFYCESEVPDADLAGLKWFPIVGIVLCAVFSSFGSFVIPTVMLGELYSANIKAKAVCVLIVTFGVVFSASNFAFYYLNSRVGMYGPFLLFGITNIVSSLLSFVIMPETAGKTLEEIQLSLSK